MPIRILLHCKLLGYQPNQLRFCYRDWFMGLKKKNERKIRSGSPFILASPPKWFPTRWDPSTDPDGILGDGWLLRNFWATSAATLSLRSPLSLRASEMFFGQKGSKWQGPNFCWDDVLKSISCWKMVIWRSGVHYCLVLFSNLLFVRW